jgi:hypothetical protein
MNEKLISNNPSLTCFCETQSPLKEIISHRKGEDFLDVYKVES